MIILSHNSEKGKYMANKNKMVFTETPFLITMVNKSKEFDVLICPLHFCTLHREFPKKSRDVTQA